MIAEATALKTGDGQVVRSFTYFPPKEGNWERVSYGEEGEYYLIFTVSSRTKDGYAKAVPTYESLVQRYKEKL